RAFTKISATQPQPAALTARQPAPATEPADAPPMGSRMVTVRRSSNGHFEVDARVDGRPVSFLVGTGASVIALNDEDAAMLGIHPAEREYTALVKTANGVARAAPVDLDRVQIGYITLRGVSAIVMPRGALSGNLLGMSFLSRLHRWEFADNKLVLEQ